jgi:hypothetical protein
MIEKSLWIAGSTIYLILGCLHLLYTFSGKKLFPRDDRMIKDMQNVSPVISKKTTIWKTWIGFNASHSMGGIFFGVANIIFAVLYFHLLKDSYLLQLLTISTSLFYFFLAIKYWFRVPATGITIASLLYITAFIMLLIKG